jgi:hypothetical protein
MPARAWLKGASRRCVANRYGGISSTLGDEDRNMCEHFIVDWQESDEDKPVTSFVSVRMQGRKAGLYRIKEVMREGVLLSHGAISFPVGTRLDIEEMHGIVPGARQSGRVVANDQRGVSLAW